MIVATIVGLLSLAVSAYTAYTLHMQTRAQVFPYVNVIDLGEQHKVGVFNKGVGPAFVKSLHVEVDGKPVPTWNDFFKSVGAEMAHGRFYYSNVNHMAIAANETLVALQFVDGADFVRYQAIDPHRYRIDLCYCSVLDECWLLHSSADMPTTPEAVRACKVDPATDFTQ